METLFAVKVDGLTQFYGSNKVLDDLSFKVRKGSVHGFLGPNGAGKTTTMKLIGGVIPATEGLIEVNTSKVGMLLENPPLFQDMLVEEYLRYICKIQGLSKNLIGSYVADALDQLNLVSVKKRLIKNLSKGYKQRVGVAQAIVFKPELVILDEPTIGLDPESVIEMRNFILKIAQAHTVLISSHLLHEIELICDDVTIINKGKLIASDSIEQVKRLTSNNINQVKLEFVGEAKLIENKLKNKNYLRGVEFIDNLCFIEMNTSQEHMINLYRDLKSLDVDLLEISKEEENLEQSFLSLLNEPKEKI